MKRVSNLYLYFDEKMWNVYLQIVDFINVNKHYFKFLRTLYQKLNINEQSSNLTAINQNQQFWNVLNLNPKNDSSIIFWGTSFELTYFCAEGLFFYVTYSCCFFLNIEGCFLLFRFLVKLKKKNTIYT